MMKGTLRKLFGAALFFAWMLIRHPSDYPSCRRILIVMTAIGLAIHAIYPLAPPRMFPEAGFSDTLAEHASVSHDSGVIQFA